MGPLGRAKMNRQKSTPRLKPDSQGCFRHASFLLLSWFLGIKSVLSSSTALVGLQTTLKGGWLLFQDELQSCGFQDTAGLRHMECGCCMAGVHTGDTACVQASRKDESSAWSQAQSLNFAGSWAQESLSSSCDNGVLFVSSQQNHIFSQQSWTQRVCRERPQRTRFFKQWTPQEGCYWKTCLQWQLECKLCIHGILELQWGGFDGTNQVKRPHRCFSIADFSFTSSRALTSFRLHGCRPGATFKKCAPLAHIHAYLGCFPAHISKPSFGCTILQGVAVEHFDCVRKRIRYCVLAPGCQVLTTPDGRLWSSWQQRSLLQDFMPKKTCWIVQWGCFFVDRV